MSRAWLLAPVAAAVVVAIVLSTTGAPATENASSTVDRLRQCRSGDTAPTVVLVHGAWADASSWAGEVRMLQRAGVRVRAIANPVEDLTTDARYVADFLQTIRGPIVLVGHSYGGAVITNAAAGLAESEGPGLCRRVGTCARGDQRAAQRVPIGPHHGQSGCAV